MKAFCSTLAASILLFCLSSNADAAGAPQEKFAWALRAPLIAANSETGVAELDGKIYVIGGYPWDRKTVATVLVYDSRADKWQTAATLPVPLNHVMPAAVGGKVYVIGGQTSEQSDPDKAGFVDTVYEYDPIANRWATKASMPSARSGGAAAVVGGKIYVAGGRPPAGNHFAVYDPSTDGWTKLPDLPTQRNHLAAGPLDGKIYVFGGRFGGGFQSERTDAVEVYDPKTKGWSKRSKLFKPRGGVNGIFANGCFHLFGGEGNPDHPYHVFPDHDYYDPVKDAWHRLDPMPVPVHGVTGLAFIDGNIHLPGGGLTQGGASGASIHQVYRPAMSCR